MSIEDAETMETAVKLLTIEKLINISPYCILRKPQALVYTRGSTPCKPKRLWIRPVSART
ncbi:MAG TPA: hypothetical protein DGZ94_21135 [Serratia sp.]|nr:hypothetical protein [Serratia sp. (in: enterobacteria)]